MLSQILKVGEARCKSATTVITVKVRLPIRRSSYVIFLGNEEKVIFLRAKGTQFFIKEGFKPMKKLLLTLLTFVLLFSMVACGGETHVIKETDEKIIITVSSKQMELTDSTTLLEYMQSLKKDGEFEFEIVSGMITSINGIENPADWSSCWMLYTNDTELSNSTWGTAEYNGETFGSAIVGAEELIVKNGYKYIWYYQSFNL